MIIENDLAYLLQIKPYRENSAIVILLTKSHGRINVIANNIKNKKECKKAILQLGQQLIVNYQLKDNLSSLTQASIAKHQVNIGAKNFILMSYINEIIIKCIPEKFIIDNLFKSYINSMTLLSHSEDQLALRFIEVLLIQQLISIPNLSKTQDTDEEIKQDYYYYFDINSGVYSKKQIYQYIRIKGINILAFHKLCNGSKSSDIARDSKIMTSYLIQHLLNGKKLNTVTFYKDLKRYF